MEKNFKEIIIEEEQPTVIVGCGLAGLCSSITLSKLGKKSIILEKEPKIGGNSQKASSGINGVFGEIEKNFIEEEEKFIEDTLKSGKGLSEKELVETLVKNSKDAVEFLNSFEGINLTEVSQLGGHSSARTFRMKQKPGESPRNIGWILINSLSNYVKNDKNIKIETNSKVSKLLTDENGKICGLKYEKGGNIYKISTKNIILATGGYGQDRDGILSKFAPNLINLPSTNSLSAKGEGIHLGVDIGAKPIHLDSVQIHPTGLLDKKNPEKKTVFLSPEAFRGLGGILLNNEGKRFVNELSTRDLVSKSILENSSKKFSNGPINAILLINKETAEKFGISVVEFYQKFGLVFKVNSLNEFCEKENISIEIVKNSIDEYSNCAKNKITDKFGKKVYPVVINSDENEYWYMYVCPSIHYTCGGLKFNKNAQIIDKYDKPIEGLYGAGEVTGGLHGGNRLGGNSLLECVVFGRIAGQQISEKEDLFEKL